MDKKRFFTIFAVCILTVITSQCFAQSQTKSAEPQAQNDKRNLEIIEALYYYIQENYVDEVDSQKLYEGALKGMLESLDDPHSSYMDVDAWRDITDTTSGEFGGVGLSISKAAKSTPEDPAYVRVAQPIDNSPGFRAGIQSGDLIIKINGTDTSTITMNEVLGMLRGPVGESVTVTIKRGKNLIFDKTLVRAIIKNPTVTYGMIGTVGYTRISEFSANTAKDLQESLNSFAENNYTGLIIDLRDNGGGLLRSAIDIADKFIDEGVIVSTKGRVEYENASYRARKTRTTVRNMPVVVLINGGSASASEILSGALKDTKKAYLVGEKSYGKGSVQVPTALTNNDGFKITVARYYSPTDTNIDKTGIIPDREVKYPEFSDEEAKAFEKLLEDDVITKYVAEHKNMNEAQIKSYAASLKLTYNLEDRVLRKLIRNEVNKNKASMLYDLDYDLQLKEALNILNNEDFNKLMKKTKSLKELQKETMKDESQAKK